jgi:hypothetical protein
MLPRLAALSISMRLEQLYLPRRFLRKGGLATKLSANSSATVVVRMLSGRLGTLTSDYLSRLAHRYAKNLLWPHVCDSCGRLNLDPIGWAGKHRPLCEKCADAEEAA